MIENYINQIAKTLLSQKEIIFAFVKSQNNGQISKAAEQYKVELDKLKTISDEFLTIKNKKSSNLEANNIENSSDENSINQFKLQVAEIKSELVNLKSKKDSIQDFKERIEKLELNYTIFKKNQEFCSDFQFNDFLTVYNSTMESTRESIRMNHEDIMKLKALTYHLQQKPDFDSIINSIRCLKREVKLIKYQGTNIDSKSKNRVKTPNEINVIEKISVYKNNLPPNLKDEFEQQSNEFKKTKSSISCIKHEMRNLKVLVEDNIDIACRVDKIAEKLKRLKEKIKLENSSSSSPKRGVNDFDEDSTHQIRNDLQILKNNFVETFNSQNSSIVNQSNQIKALRKMVEGNINDRLRIIEAKLQIITSLAGES